MKKSLLLIPLLLFISNLLMAQFTLSGEIRPRAEYRNGFKSLTQTKNNPAVFVEQRSRLYFNYKNEKYELQLTLQDIRLWGEDAQIYKTDNGMFNVYEAWASYNLTKKLSIRVGRQFLEYDNARFLGDLDWAQQGRSHDLLLLKYGGSFNLHFGAAFNQEDLNSNPEPGRLSGTFYKGPANYKAMQFLWLNKEYDAGKTSLLLLNNGQQLADSSVNFSQTAGIYSQNKLGSMTLLTEAYYQIGKDAADLTVDAYMASIAGSIPMGAVTLTLGGDYLSGTSYNSTKNTSFNPLYGTNHKFYGLMDYFYVGNPHKNAGLIDVFLKAAVKTGQNSKLLIDLHQFMTEVTMLEADGSNANKNLGNEVDVVWNLDLIKKEVNLKIGYSEMFGTSTMELIKGGSSNQINNWAWVMFTVKPTFFQSKNDQ